MKKPDYRINNYCRRCRIVYPKDKSKCDNCNHFLKRSPSSGLRNKKYQELKKGIWTLIAYVINKTDGNGILQKDALPVNIADYFRPFYNL